MVVIIVRLMAKSEKQVLKDQTVVIFGGGRGIGRAIALDCAKQGAKIAVAARSAKELDDVAGEARKLYDARVMTAPCDVSDYEQVTAFVARAERELGPTQGLVCAAGIYGAIGPIEE